jgi:pyridoxal biosynthesis lyase PdxS
VPSCCKEASDMTETAFTLKTGLAEMLKGGVIMDVTTAD